MNPGDCESAEEHFSWNYSFFRRLRISGRKSGRKSRLDLGGGNPPSQNPAGWVGLSPPVCTAVSLPAFLLTLTYLNKPLRSFVEESAAAPSSGPTWKISCSVFSVEL